MQNRSIIFTAPRTAEYLDFPMPEMKPDSVNVKLEVSSVSSGTERANVIGDTEIGTGKNPEVPQFPRYGGYSSAGIVTAVGEAVTSVKVGDRVALSWSQHRRYIAVPEKQVYKLPDSVSSSVGALVHISIFPLAAIRKCRLEMGESALVVGLGVLGLLAVKLLRASGAAPVIVADFDGERRKKALEYGADYAFDPREEGFFDNVKSLTNGGVKVAIEVTGNDRALDTTLDCMAKFGRVALLGCTRHSNFAIDYYKKVHGRGITLIGAHTRARPEVESSNGWWTQRDDAQAVIKLLELGRLDFSDMVEDTRLPEEAPEVYRRLCDEPTFPITQFDWTKEDI